MKRFNQEQLDGLRQYEDVFFKAVHQNYYRSMSTKTLDALKSVYDETQDKPYGANWACSHCVLKFLQAIGAKYYEDKEFHTQRAVELVKAMDEVFGEVPDEEPVLKELEPRKKKTDSKPATGKSNKKVTKK